MDIFSEIPSTYKISPENEISKNIVESKIQEEIVKSKAEEFKCSTNLLNAAVNNIISVDSKGNITFKFIVFLFHNFK